MWKTNSPRVALGVALVAGLWSCQPTKPAETAPSSPRAQKEASPPNYEYCAEFVYRWHVPHCLKPLGKAVAQQREATYRIGKRNGRVVEMASVGPRGHLIAFDADIVRKEYHYEGDRVTSWDSFDIYGTVRVVHRVSEDGKLVEYFDPWGNRVPLQGPGVAGERYRFDERGRIVERNYVNAEGALVADQHGLVTSRFSWKPGDLVVEKTHWGVDGRPSVDTEGAHRVVYRPAPDGRLLEKETFDEQGRPAPDQYGRFRTQYDYDEVGNLERLRYFRPDGSPGHYEQGAHEMRFVRDELGREISSELYDGQGAPMVGEWKYHRLTTSYDDDGYQLAWAYFGKYGEPVTVWSDQHATRITRDGVRVLRETSLGTDGEPLAQPTSTTHLDFVYDAAGNVLSETDRDVGENPVAPYGNYARGVWEYDEFNREVRLRYEAADGSPATNWDDVHEVRTEYLEDGLRPRTTRYNAEGELLEGYEYTAIHITYAPLVVDDLPQRARFEIEAVQPGALRSREQALERAKLAIQELRARLPPRAVCNRYTDLVPLGSFDDVGYLIEPIDGVPEEHQNSLRQLEPGQVSEPLEMDSSFWVFTVHDVLGPRPDQ